MGSHIQLSFHWGRKRTVLEGWNRSAVLQLAAFGPHETVPSNTDVTRTSM